MMKKKCPVCNSPEGVREFIYGMPSEEPDESEHVLGGCLVEPEASRYIFILCGVKFDKAILPEV